MEALLGALDMLDCCQHAACVLLGCARLAQVFNHQHLVRLMAASCFACAGIIFLLDQAQKQPTVKLLPAVRCGVEERLGMTGRQHHQHTGPQCSSQECTCMQNTNRALPP